MLHLFGEADNNLQTEADQPCNKLNKHSKKSIFYYVLEN